MADEITVVAEGRQPLVHHDNKYSMKVILDPESPIEGFRNINFNTHPGIFGSSQGGNELVDFDEVSKVAGDSL